MAIEIQGGHVLAAVLLLAIGFGGGAMLARGGGNHTSTVVQVLSVAGPSQSELDDLTAKANVRAAVPAVEAYNSDSTNGYAGLSLGALQSYDAGVTDVVVVSATSTSYCVESTVGTGVWHKDGPGAVMAPGAC
jgi:hypothetical protein